MHKYTILSPQPSSYHDYSCSSPQSIETKYYHYLIIDLQKIHNLPPRSI